MHVGVRLIWGKGESLIQEIYVPLKWKMSAKEIEISLNEWALNK